MRPVAAGSEAPAESRTSSGCRADVRGQPGTERAADGPDGRGHRRGRGGRRRELGLPADSIGPRIAAVAATGVLIEITDLPPGEARAQATTTALAFLDAGIRT